MRPPATTAHRLHTRPPPRSLQYNDLGEDGKQAINDANAKRATPAKLEL